MDYIIENKIPVPVSRNDSTKFPFKEMNVGDSFIICDDYSYENQVKFGNLARSWARTYNPLWKFSLRREDGCKIRIWRIK